MDYTGYLYARSGFLYGVASVLDLRATLNYYNEFETPEEADAMAIYSDWLAVGGDLQFAFNQFKKEHTDILNVEEETS